MQSTLILQVNFQSDWIQNVHMESTYLKLLALMAD